MSNLVGLTPSKKRHNLLFLLSFGLLLLATSCAEATERVAQIQMDFENRMEPYETMPTRSPDPNGTGNGCMGGEAWNEYYKFNVCVSPTCDLSDYTIERSTKYARSGNQSLRFFLRPTSPDQWPNGEATHRAELAPHHNSPVKRYPQEGDEFWYGISYYFPSDFMFAPQSIENDIRFIIAQWQHGTAGSPIIALEVMGDDLVLQRQGGISQNSDWIDPVSIGKINRGRWMDIVVQAKWSKNNGLVNIWVNGNQTYAQSNIQTIYHDLNVGGGFKIGLYYWRWKELQSVQNSLDAGITYREIYIDEVREYQGTDGFEIVSPAQSALLPIEWLDFDVALQSDRSVKLEWKTVSESNNDLFAIERSNNATEWHELHQLSAVGNSVQLHTYTSLDDTPYDGYNYYRIKQIDVDGKYSYSPVKSIQLSEQGGLNLKIFPNPVMDKIFLEGAEDELEVLEMYDLMGRNIQHDVAIVYHGSNRMEVDVSGLPPGIFTFKTRSDARQIIKH